MGIGQLESGVMRFLALDSDQAFEAMNSREDWGVFDQLICTNREDLLRVLKLLKNHFKKKSKPADIEVQNVEFGYTKAVSTHLLCGLTTTRNSIEVLLKNPEPGILKALSNRPESLDALGNRLLKVDRMLLMALTKFRETIVLIKEKKDLDKADEEAARIAKEALSKAALEKRRAEKQEEQDDAKRKRTELADTIIQEIIVDRFPWRNRAKI